MKNVQHSQWKQSGISVFTGTLVGLGVGLLLAPQSGASTRRHIKNLALDTGEQMRETYEDSRKAMDKFAQRSQQSWEGLSKKLESFRIQKPASAHQASEEKGRFMKGGQQAWDRLSKELASFRVQGPVPAPKGQTEKGESLKRTVAPSLEPQGIPLVFEPRK